jgi:hypothetical protein
MGYGAETLFADELACLATDAVGFVPLCYQGSCSELMTQLTLCEPAGLLTFAQ